MKYFSTTRIRPPIIFFTLFLLLFIASAHPFDVQVYAQNKVGLSELRIKKSVVMLKITPVYHNIIRPWIQESRKSSHAIALVLPGKKLLALADDLENAVLIEASQYSSYEKTLASVIHVDRAANLALLSVNKANFFKKLKAVNLGKNAAPGQSLSGVRVDKLFHVYREKVKIQEINLISETGFTDLPLYSFHSQDNFPLGGLLLDRKRICGFISYSGKKGDGEAILPSIIQAFLSNSKKKSKSYFDSSFISQGFRLKSLVDPIKRSYYGIPYKNKGALVSRILPGTSAWGILQNKDILLSIDGIPVDNLGLYEDIHGKWGHQNAELMLTIKKQRVRKAGEIVKLTVLRKGKKKKLKMKLRVYHGQGERIPSTLQGPPNYLVENGIIFLELSVPLLKALYGDKWKQKTDHASYLFQTQRYYKSQNPAAKEGAERILLIGGIFPDPSTQGLSNFRGAILEKINGKKILNLKSFRKNIIELARSGQKTAKTKLLRRPTALFGSRKSYADQCAYP